MKDSTKIVIAAIGIAGAVGVAVYAIETLTGPVGGSCNDPSTPCGAATAPYKQEFLKCSKLYWTYLDSFLKEDAAANTGLTAAQLSELGYLKTCMDTAAANIAKTAHQYAPADAIGILASSVGDAVIIGAALVGFSYILKVIRTTPISGASNANIADNVVMRGNVDNGVITPEQASALSDQLSSLTEENIASFEDFTSLLVESEVITEETASALVAAAETAMDADEAETAAELAGVG